MAIRVGMSKARQTFSKRTDVQIILVGVGDIFDQFVHSHPSV